MKLIIMVKIIDIGDLVYGCQNAKSDELIFQNSCFYHTIHLRSFTILMLVNSRLSSKSSREKAIENIQFFCKRRTRSYFIQANLISLSSQ